MKATCATAVGIVLACGATLANGQTFAEAIGSTRNESEAEAVVFTSDGGWAVAGTDEAFSTVFEQDFFVARFNADGTTAWTVRVGNAAYERAWSMVELPGGDLVVAGTYRDAFFAGFALEGIAVVRLDASGNVVWANLYSGSATFSGPSMILDQAGNLVIATFAQPPLVSSEMGQLLRLDADGKSISNTLYPIAGNDGSQTMRFEDIVDDASGSGYVISGTHAGPTFGGTDTDQNFAVVRVAGGGAVISAKTFGVANLPDEPAVEENGTSLVRLADGTLALVGQTSWQGFFGNGGAHHLRLDSNGSSVLNSVRHRDPSYSDLRPAHDGMRLSPDGNLVVAANSSFGDGGSVHRWYMVDPGGNHLWHSVGPGFPVTLGNSRIAAVAIKLNPNGLSSTLVSGSSDFVGSPIGGADMMLVRSDEFGQVGCGELCFIPESESPEMIVGAVDLQPQFIGGSVVWNAQRIGVVLQRQSDCGGKLCAADLNADGMVDLVDFFDFFTGYDNFDEIADVNNDCNVDLADFFEFFSRFDSGCV